MLLKVRTHLSSSFLSKTGHQKHLKKSVTFTCFKLNSIQIWGVTCAVVYILLIIYAMVTAYTLEIFIQHQALKK